MCEAVSGMIAQARDAAGSKPKAKQKTRNPLLIEDKPGLPVGKGGRKRERDIMALVDGAQTGLQIPRQ